MKESNTMRPTKYEKETIILTSDGDHTWDVYTFNAVLKRRLADFAKKCLDQCKLKSGNSDGAVTYTVAKARLAIRLTEPYSEERRNAARKQTRKTFQK